MLFIYRILINFIFILSPLIILFRLLKKKENPIRVKEKLGLFSKKKLHGKLIWFHGASVGELQSVVPLVEKFEKDRNIKQILITSNTLSSSKIIKNLNLKKVVHQFFPIDTNFISKRFINYWKPSKVFFIDSEIWPNIILNLKEKKIPIILINGRITKKTFKRWKYLSSFSSKIFSSFNLCLASGTKSFFYLKKLNASNIKLIGNLKFSQSENKITKLNNKLMIFLKNKKIWCASSTHQSEELICGMVHLSLKKRIKNLITIIIPRHVERSMQIKKELEKLNLIVHVDEPKYKINPNTDIYLVNSYGKTKKFFTLSKNVFLGGSLIDHGGQNPLEAARFGCNVLHGPNVHNFSEIYEFLEKNRISHKVLNQNAMTNSLRYLFNKKTQINKIQKKLKFKGKDILNKSFKEINLS